MTHIIIATLKCSLGCLMCFEEPTRRQITEQGINYDVNAIKKAIEIEAKKYNLTEITLHGGEALLMKIEDIIDIAEHCKKLGLKIAIQTGGVTITDKHIEIFKKYDFTVGISCDGFDECNELRGWWIYQGKPIRHPSSDRYTQMLIKTIERIAKEGINFGIISLASRANMGDEKRINKFIDFVNWLYEIGCRSLRINPMYAISEYVKPYELSNDELYNAYTYIYDKIRKPNFWISPYNDIICALLGDFDNTVCWFGGCGYWHSFVWSILPDGSISTCDRAIQSGIWLRDSDELLNINPRVYGLANKYKYVHIHQGGCPAEAIDLDWRRESRFIPFFERLIEFLYKRLREYLPNNYILTADYQGDPIEFIKYVKSGYKWDIRTGRFIRYD
jgi:uncharacterized protein